MPEFLLILFAGAIGAGLLGALTGLGGGVIITPLLVLAMGVDMKYAVGASLVAVVATSCGAAPRAIARGLANTRLAILLCVATAIGALLGVLLASVATSSTLEIIFSIILLWTAAQGIVESLRTNTPTLAPHASTPTDARSCADRLGLHTPEYRVSNLASGWWIMLAAGTLSALVGIGSGIVKVLALDKAMRLPFQASTATSTLMIGVTAAASVGPYAAKGQIVPELALPIALGAWVGAMLGARLVTRMKTRTLRIIFSIVVLGAGVQMLSRGLGWWGAAGGTP